MNAADVVVGILRELHKFNIQSLSLVLMAVVCIVAMLVMRK
jgi:hypothetical protein